MVDGPGVVPVGDADKPRREFRPAASDLPIEVRAFDGGANNGRLPIPNPELNLAQAQLSELLALVQIYRSLGGGWQN